MDNEMIRRMLDLPMLRWRNDEMKPLIDLLPERALVVELGCFAGGCSQQFAASPKVAYLVCVDAYRGGYDGDDKASGSDMEAAKQAFHLRMDRFKNWRRWTLDTVKAAENHDDNSIDLVYIDADHRYEAVKADIAAWRRKVAKGGYIGGHDYGVNAHPGVKRAVDEAFGKPDKVFDDTSWVVRL